MIEVAHADRILAEHVGRLPATEVPLAAAVGRVLRREIRTDREQPPYDRVTMDGVAVLAAAVADGRRTFRRQGDAPAGRPASTLDAADACIEVMTGAVLPEGADAVVRIEDVHLEGDAATLADGVEVRSRQNVHARGSDAPEGRTVVEPGARLASTHVGIAAAMGLATLPVSERPLVAVVSTGDELVAVDAAPEPHQVRRSNGPALAAALTSHGAGVPRTDHLGDDLEALTAGLAPHLDACDVVILCGGVSMGRWDLVPTALAQAGVTERFHRVRQRPGKPLWFGTRDDVAVFGLPGNPVSALTCLYRYVLPFLDRAAGATARPRLVRTAREVRGHPELTRFVPVRLDPDGGATPLETRTSGDFLTLGRSDGFVELAAGLDAPVGTELAFRPWGGA